MHFIHENSMTCSSQVEFDMDADHIVHNVKYTDGCNGNTQGVAALAEGMKAEDYIERCKGIHCGRRPTSCPAQLALALEEAIAKI